MIEFPYLVLVSDQGGYTVHRMIATMDGVPIYSPASASFDTIEAAIRFGSTIAEREL